MTYTPACTACLTSITEIGGGIGNGAMRGRGYRGDDYSPQDCDFGLVGGEIPTG